jgi:hypothetical protein
VCAAERAEPVGTVLASESPPSRRRGVALAVADSFGVDGRSKSRGRRFRWSTKAAIYRSRRIVRWCFKSCGSPVSNNGSRSSQNVPSKLTGTDSGLDAQADASDDGEGWLIQSRGATC